METKIGIVKKSQYKTTEWSGGTTTELLIYPGESKYSDRSFKWRISSAEVEASESTFTYLPGIARHIMIIDGQVILVHENRYKKTLGPFEQDSFMGDWKTKCYGKATDFNLMLADGFTGKLDVHFIDEGEKIDILLSNGDADKITNVLYTLNGNLDISINGQKFKLEEKDLFYITRFHGEEKGMLKLINRSEQKLVVIMAVIEEQH
ncbi:MAG: HutD family protein [Clostridiaceae bacterium]